MYNLAVLSLNNCCMFCYFQEIITKILNYCQSYVAKKQSNLTNWHPILGWFKQSTDEQWVITHYLFVLNKIKNKNIIADAMLTPLLCHRNISWWQWYYASSHLLQGGPYCRVSPTAGWALLQGGPYCRVGPTAGWALLQSGQWCPKISSFPGPSSHKNSIQNTSYYDPKLKFISSPWKVAKGHMIRTLVFSKWGLLTNCSKKKKKRHL